MSGRRKFKGPMLETEYVEIENEIDLIELFYRSIEKFWYIALAAALCTSIAGIYSFFIAKPVYQATAKLYVISPKDSVLNLSDLQIGSYLTSDYQEVFKAWEVHEMVIQELELDYSYTKLESMLSISNPSNTRILNITVSSGDPLEAKKLANTYAEIARDYISGTMATEKPNILSDALLPVNPISPNKARNILLGFVIGALLGIGIITIQFVFDDKIKTSEDILRYAGLPTLSVVPMMKKDDEKMKV